MNRSQLIVTGIAQFSRLTVLLCMKSPTFCFLAMICLAQTAAIAQTQFNYVDPSVRSSRRDERRSPSSTPATNAGASAARPTPAARSTASTVRSSSSSKATTAGKTLAKPVGQPGAPGQPPGAPGQPPGGSKAKPGAAGTGFASSGEKIKEVTREMVEAMRTRKVDFDTEEMAKKPGVIMLNPRKLKADPISEMEPDLSQPL